MLCSQLKSFVDANKHLCGLMDSSVGVGDGCSGHEPPFNLASYQNAEVLECPQ